ncbi:MAG: methionine synthase [Gemmatimonadetes bacterium]|nr:methionine synthase [Gemmatimonadota bacterium]
MAKRRSNDLETALRERILVVDGATGTWMQQQSLTADDFGGREYEGCNEHLNVSRPDVVEKLHLAHIEAGADIIETNTFGGASIVLAEYGLEKRSIELNREAARIARSVADRSRERGRSVWVAGSMGPTTKAISVTGGATFEELRHSYGEQAQGLLEGSVDLLAIETAQDTRNVKAALLGVEDAIARGASRAPLMISCTIEPTGTMLAGQGVEAFFTSIRHADPLIVGLNCGTGPDFMTDHLRALAAMATTNVACIPNAGLPDEEGRYLESPEELALVMERFVDRGWLNVVGGCCGTTPEHIRALAGMVEGKRPRTPEGDDRCAVSGIDFVAIEEENRPLLVGERTNVVGSRKFRRLIEGGKLAEAAEVGRAQVRAGAQIIDVCLAEADRDEAADMDAFLQRLTRVVKAPIMVDSTDPRVLEVALPHCQGATIVNSINLEEGEDRLDAVVPMARRFGALFVVGTIDEEGMAVTRARKLDVAHRLHGILARKYGLRDRDLIWDPLTFPCATGDSAYEGSAEETIEGIRLIKQAYPESKTILGVSNISFGLPPAGREVLNSVFLYLATKAGLDLAIVNSQKLERYASIPPAEVELSTNLLLSRGQDPIGEFVAHFRGASGRRAPSEKKHELPLDERLAAYVVEGTREGLARDLDRKLEETPALEIVNGPLMEGMAEVGRLFNANELIVAEVLQSAEVMKLAVSQLEAHMERSDAASRGKVLLATVKGDVHDIGKNLVQIIFSNNGYRVVDLGTKVPPAALIEAVRREQPGAIGLSGLLVKSAHQMVATAQDLHEEGIDLPLLVGGAALSARFANERIAPVYGGPVMYAKDAMSGLSLLRGVAEQGGSVSATHEARSSSAGRRPRRKTPKKAEANKRLLVASAPRNPDTERHLIREIPFDLLWSWVNPQMLFGKHLGLKGKLAELIEDGDQRAIGLDNAVREIRSSHPPTVNAAWRFFPAGSEGDALHLFDPEGSGAPVHTFSFKRQPDGDRLCLSDLVQPIGPDGVTDHVALLVTSAGVGVRERAAELRERGEYLASHIVQALALETAEAAAEWLHARLRSAWGFPDGEDLTMTDRFRARYRGMRYSFGYPACPDLSDQAALFGLLRPEEIGVELTEDFMMDPEASVSAIVFHHPDARYFSVGDSYRE